MRALVLTAVLALAADVMPSCGKREPRTAQAGDSCGGPFVCAGGSTCVTLDESISMPGWSSAYVCTKACAADSDCASFAMPMKCTGMGRVSGYSKPSESVCIPVIADSGTR